MTMTEADQMRRSRFADRINEVIHELYHARADLQADHEDAALKHIAWASQRLAEIEQGFK